MRMEFEVLDLAGVSNVQASDLPRTPPVAGDLRLRGIPFAIGIPSKGEHRYLGLGEELKVEPVEIAIDRPASHLLFAFSMLDSPLRAGGPFGYPCMELTIKTAAAEHHVTVREGFEIGALPAREFEFPMLAWPDRSDNMAPRREGAWIDWGMRQMEVEIPHPQDFYLWAWKNPARDDRVVSLRIEPNHARFIIGGITVGDLDEEPFGQFRRANRADWSCSSKDRRTVRNYSRYWSTEGPLAMSGRSRSAPRRSSSARRPDGANRRSLTTGAPTSTSRHLRPPPYR